MKFYVLALQDANAWSDEVFFSKREAITRAKKRIREGAAIDKWNEPNCPIETAVVILHKVPNFNRKVVKAMIDRHSICKLQLNTPAEWTTRVVWAYEFGDEIEALQCLE